MSYDSSAHSNSSFLQDTLPLSSPDTGLYQFFNNSQSSQENKNLNMSNLRMNSHLSISNRGFSSTRGSESQPVSKYGNTLSFSNSQLIDNNNNSLSQPIGAFNRPVKSFKDVDFVKQRVLNSSVIGSDKVIVESVVQSIKEITSGLFETIKNLTGEIVNLRAKIDATQDTTNAKHDQIKQLNNQMNSMQLKVNQLLTCNTKIENNVDELVFKQSQASTAKSSISQIASVEQTIGGILNQLNQSQAESDTKLSAKMTEKFDDLKTLIIDSKSYGDTSIHETKMRTYKSICRKYKRLRKSKQTPLIQRIDKKANMKKSKKKSHHDTSTTSQRLAQTFNMMSLSGELKWTRTKENPPLEIDTSQSSPRSSNNSSSTNPTTFSVFDFSSY